MKLFFSLIIFFLPLLAKVKPLVPWYTGSLLSTSGRVMDVGDYAYQPYLFFTDEYGSYDDNYSFRSQTSLYQIQTIQIFQGSLTSFADFQILGQAFSNFKKGASSTNIGDTNVLLGLQVSWAKPGTYIPDIRLTISETFPTGKYDNLSPSKLGTDETGEGSFQTNIALNYQQLFYPSPCHPLRIRMNVRYSILSDLCASNFHAYGGEKGAEDHVNPGNQILFLFSPEYSLSQKWVITADLTYQHNWETIVKTEKPESKKGEKTILPSQDLFAFAPAIEYNFSKDLGIIGGVWFSLAGRNTEAFASLVFSLVYNF